MAKFMNAELYAIRDALTCGHCGCTFQGSDSQARKVKYEKKTVYCSDACRHAALRNTFSKPIPNRGPCPTCGKTFFSRLDKKFCSLDCYVKSPQFQAMAHAAKPMTAEARERGRQKQLKGSMLVCLECGVEFYGKRSKSRKFCTSTCYRSFLAKRFDRWIANPEGMALPQCYDEFLGQEELPCLAEGCEWVGRHLTTHMNMAHGVRSDEFKRAAGFNLNTGVIARPLAELMQARPLRGVATPDIEHIAPPDARGKYMRYRSAEACEHHKKAVAIAAQTPGPERTCRGCGAIFTQPTTMGRKLFHSIECRDAFYASQRTRRKSPRQRDDKGQYIGDATP